MMNETLRLPVLASWWGGLGAQAFILGVPAGLLFLALAWRQGRWRIVLPVLVLFALLLAASPVRTWARMVLFELAFYALAFAWVLVHSARWPRILLLGVFTLLTLYNVGRTLPAIQYRTRPADLLAYPFLTGFVRGVQVDEFPDGYSVLDFWREVIARPGTVLALPEGRPWSARPLAPGASCIRVRRLQEYEDPAAYAHYLRETGATHLYAIRGGPELEAALNSRDSFLLLLRRLDSGAETQWTVSSPREAALFEIRPVLEERP